MSKQKITSENSMQPEIRQQYLGGTDAAAICGLSQYKTAFDVFIAKTQKAPEQAYNEIFAWGHILEGPIAEEYVKRFGGKIVNANMFTQDKEFPFLASNTDRIIEKDGDTFILECKTASTGAFSKWSMGVPIEYYCQGQWYLGQTGLKKLVFAILVMDSRKLETFEIEFDEAFYLEIKGICVSFWQNHVCKAIPPDLETDDYAKIVVIEPKSSVYADAEELIIYQEIKDLKKEIKKLEGEVDAKAEVIQSKIQDKELMTLPDGKALFSWKPYTRTSVDSNALQAGFPEAYEACKKVSTSRTFSIK